ncbi:MAG TPA: GNAT family N-acetyltransferase [Sediminispirochaeta sp.]|nr:GNAT family N-acetyltransferase [Sediminispirochaeta sp.]
MLSIREIKSRKELKSFVNFPFEVFENNPYWVPPIILDELNTLDWNKNPAFEYCGARYWMAEEDGRVVGRIAAIRNDRFIEKWDKPYLRFGWFDTVDRFEVAEALLGKVEEWAREQGLTAVHGPMGFTDLDPEGLLVEGFEERGTLPMIYNHPYYPSFLEQLGYRKDVDWLQFEIPVPEKLGEKYTRTRELVLKRNKLRLVQIERRRDIQKIGRKVFQTLNSAYANLYGVVELTDRQVESYIKQYLSFVNLDFIKLIENHKDGVVGFAIAMPRLTEALRKSKGRLFPFGFLHLLKAMKKPKEIVFYLIGIRPDYQQRGLDSILLSSLYETCIEYGISSVQTCGELETNTKVISLMKNFDSRVNKRRRCYIKELAPKKDHTRR